MTTTDRALVTLLAVGIWLLVAMQIASVRATYAQQAQATDTAESQVAQQAMVIHANDIVGLSAFVQQTVREQQFRPQSMPGLDQYIRSIVRNCRINGYVSGNRLSGTSISC